MQRPLVWLDLDSTDAATGRLLTYLEAALARQVPEAAGVATSALAAHLPHAEVAGLLAEAIGDVPVLIVLDDAERLAGAPDALEVLASFARYLPPFARLLVASRTELPFRSSVGTLPWAAAVGEEDLALTVDEAAEALAVRGRSDIDPVDAVVETGGWMTGVLFEAWEAADHVIGLGGEADPLHGYLATEILGQLAEEDAEFLISTAVLTEVTVPRAEALGLASASARMHSLAGARLPVSWLGHSASMRCHPRFREFLLKRLDRRGEAEQRVIYRAHARLLLSEGHDEEAVEEYLRAGCADDALQIVRPVLERVIERTDFAQAERWLQALAPARPPGDISLAASELMLTVVQEKFAAGVELADQLDRLGQRRVLAANSGRAAGLMAGCTCTPGGSPISMPSWPRRGPPVRWAPPSTRWPSSAMSRAWCSSNSLGSSRAARWTPWSCAPTSILAGCRSSHRPQAPRGRSRRPNRGRSARCWPRAARSRPSSCTTLWSTLRSERVAVGTGRAAAYVRDWRPG